MLLFFDCRDETRLSSLRAARLALDSIVSGTPFVQPKTTNKVCTDETRMSLNRMPSFGFRPAEPKLRDLRGVFSSRAPCRVWCRFSAALAAHSRSNQMSRTILDRPFGSTARTSTLELPRCVSSWLWQRWVLILVLRRWRTVYLARQFRLFRLPGSLTFDHFTLIQGMHIAQGRTLQLHG